MPTTPSMISRADPEPWQPRPLVFNFTQCKDGPTDQIRWLREFVDLVTLETVGDLTRLLKHISPALLILDFHKHTFDTCPLVQVRRALDGDSNPLTPPPMPPIAVVLPKSSAIDEAALRSHGASAILRAPVKREEFLAACKSCISAASPQNGSTNGLGSRSGELSTLKEDLIQSQIAYETTDKLLKSATQRLAEAYQHRNELVQERNLLQNEIEIASQQLIQADRLATIGSLVAGVAHDITNPTNLISMNKEVLFSNLRELETVVFELLGEPTSNEVRILIDMFEKVFSSSKVALQDITLGVDRIYAINQAIRKQSRRDDEKTEFLISELIRESITIVRSKSKSAEINLKGDPTATFTGYRSHLGQVFMNLLSNGLDAAEPSEDRYQHQALVEIGYQRDSQFLHIWVEDNGPGIPEDLRAKIFTPFFTTKPSGKGTGLGMPIIKKIIDEHNGRIDLRPFDEHLGARFDIYLPIIEASLL